MSRVFTAYLILINAAAFLLMLADKQRAKKNRWRIPERTLLTAAVLGGSFGAFCGMYLFRHKTRKPRFYITVPLCLIVHTVLLLALT